MNARSHASHAHLAIAAALLGVFSAAVAAGCTVFDGLTAAPAPGEGAQGVAYLDLDGAVRACSQIFRCKDLALSIATSIGVPADEQSFSRCVSWLAAPLPEDRAGFEVQAALLASVAAAPTCEAALACSFVEPLPPADPRCASASEDACDGEEALRCADHTLERCASPRFSPGSACRRGADGRARCALAACLPATHGPARCNGNTLIACDPSSRLRVAVDCTTLGLTCAEGAEGVNAICGANGAILPCEGAGTVACSPDGTRARICTGAIASEIDCGAIGGACVAEGSGARCSRPSDTCAPSDAGIDACNGAVLSLCVGGQRAAFDCASVGLGCQSGDSAGHSGWCG
ncbi:hypothetical protein WME79_18770 [Sorangium sp. So ce726]|uniref:hypothetical protein n=1 Tax=Sorangium sp. So ce726 TaxID=3133319 RepID=UPI003F637E5A